MSREKRTVFIVALTLLVYASSQFLESGVFLFPFPILNTILLIIAFQFIYWNRKIVLKKKQGYFLFYMLALVFKVISSEFFLAFIFNDQALEQVNSGVLPAVFLMLSVIFSALFFILWEWRQVKIVKWILLLFFISLSFTVLFESTSLLSFFVMPLFVCYLFLRKVETEFNYLFLLQGLLDIMAFTMFIQLN